MDRDTQQMLDRWEAYHNSQMRRAQAAYLGWAGISLVLAIVLLAVIVR